MLSVEPEMSVKEIMQRIASDFDLSPNAFNLQIYDEETRTYVDFDEEYAEELRQRLPQTHKKTLHAQVSIPTTKDTDRGFDLLSKFAVIEAFIGYYSAYFSADDLVLPSCDSVKSPISISAMDDQTSISTDIDLKSCVSDSSHLFKGNLLVLDDTHRSVNHIIFERDIIPYEKEQLLTNIPYGDERIPWRKISNVRRLQGLKNFGDNRYAYVLPEIKVSLLLRDTKKILF